MWSDQEKLAALEKICKNILLNIQGSNEVFDIGVLRFQSETIQLRLEKYFEVTQEKPD